MLIHRRCLYPHALLTHQVHSAPHTRHTGTINVTRTTTLMTRHPPHILNNFKAQLCSCTMPAAFPSTHRRLHPVDSRDSGPQPSLRPQAAYTYRYEYFEFSRKFKYFFRKIIFDFLKSQFRFFRKSNSIFEFFELRPRKIEVRTRKIEKSRPDFSKNRFFDFLNKEKFEKKSKIEV